MRAPSDGGGLKRFAQTRVNEIDAFVDGLFGGEEAIDMPDTAHEAVEALSELASFFEVFVQFADEPDTEAKFAETVRQAQQLSYIAEQEINEAKKVIELFASFNAIADSLRVPCDITPDMAK